MARSPKKPSPSRSGRTLITQPEQIQLKKIGLKIHRDLYDQGKTVEWLAFRVGLARSSIREIIAGRSNFRFLTLVSITQGLGYSNVCEFLNQVED
jgi:hypothetical protein